MQRSIPRRLGRSSTPVIVKTTLARPSPTNLQTASSGTFSMSVVSCMCTLLLSSVLCFWSEYCGRNPQAIERSSDGLA